MKKIPVGSTIVGSYKFLFQNIISIIGVLWLPVVISCAIVGAFLYGILPHKWLVCDFTPISDPEGFFRAKLPLILLAVPVLIITSLLASAMVRVGILRHAIGEKTKTTWIYFSLGARVWRMVAALLLYLVIYIGLEIVVRVAKAISVFILKAVPGMPEQVPTHIGDLIGLVGFIIGLYIVLRLFFFLMAVVVAENKVGVGRAWELGKGNIWRMIGVLIAIVLPVMLIVGVVFGMMAFGTIVSLAASGHPPKTDAEVLTFFKSLLPLLPVFFGIWVVAAIALNGLVLGAIGKAYKAVTAPDEVAA